MPALRSVRDSVSAAASRIVDVATTAAVVAFLVGWSAFWANLARLHYSQGDLASALFTVGAVVAPAIAILVWYVGESLGADMPAPDVGPSIPSG